MTAILQASSPDPTPARSFRHLFQMQAMQYGRSGIPGVHEENANIDYSYKLYIDHALQDNFQQILADVSKIRRIRS